MATWDQIRNGIFAGESGGDYNALFGYSNRPGGRFSSVKPTQMTVGEVANNFTAPSGEYGQWVKGQVGRVATPVGAYQVVGTTLRGALDAGIVSPNDIFDQKTQDKVGRWIYETQGTGAWEGYRGPQSGGGAQTTADNAMAAIGKQPVGNRAPRTSTNSGGILGGAANDTLEAPMQPDKATGILGSLFPDMTGDRQDRIAMALSGLSMHPNQAVMRMAQQRMGDRREDKKEARALNKQQAQVNKTLQWLQTQAQNNPNAAQALQMLSQGVIKPAEAVQFALKKPVSPETVVVGDRLVNKATGEVIGDYSADPSTIIDKDRVSAANTIRDDAATELEPFALARQGFENIQTFKNGGAVSDYALAVAFAKVLDPGSVARESEVAAVAGSGSISGALQAAILKQLNDGDTGALPESIRREIVSLSTNLYNKRAEEAQKSLQNYRDMASRNNIDPRDVYLGSEPAFFEGDARGQRPQDVRPPQARSVGVGRNQLQNAISQLSDFDKQIFDRLPSPGEKARFLMDKGLISGK